MIESIFHVNVNVTNFERSIAFYKLLGFHIINDLGEVGSDKLSEGLRMPQGRGRAVLMILGDNSRATRLDLIEWKNPKTEGQAYPNLAHAGFAGSHCEPGRSRRTTRSSNPRASSSGPSPRCSA
jgi:glyoxylase I family protein